MGAAELYDVLFGDEVDPDWRLFALCREIDGDLFFPEEREPAGRVKALCHRCAVRLECLATALTTREPHGIWGGLTYRERSRLASSLRESGVQIPRRKQRRSA